MEDREALNRVISYLSQEFIVEECAENPTDGCMSCEMIEARASLRKALYLIEEEEGAALSHEGK